MCKHLLAVRVLEMLQSTAPCSICLLRAALPPPPPLLAMRCNSPGLHSTSPMLPLLFTPTYYCCTLPHPPWQAPLEPGFNRLVQPFASIMLRHTLAYSCCTPCPASPGRPPSSPATPAWCSPSPPPTPGRRTWRGCLTWCPHAPCHQTPHQVGVVLCIYCRPPMASFRGANPLACVYLCVLGAFHGTVPMWPSLPTLGPSALHAEQVPPWRGTSLPELGA